MGLDGLEVRSQGNISSEKDMTGVLRVRELNGKKVMLSICRSR